jgi:DNA ligase-1
MPQHCILDGELFMGRKRFSETVSIVKSHKMSEQWKDITYMVFDIPSERKRPFEERLAILREYDGDHRKNFKIVEQRPVNNTDNIETMLREVEALGGEGLMFRQPKSLYIGKRSDSLLKMKSFTDDEAKVIGYTTEAKGRLSGLTGSLMVVDRHGVEFDVGSGLTDELRHTPPPIGSIITFRYQEKIEKTGRPRFPVYCGLAIDKTFP